MPPNGPVDVPVAAFEALQALRETIEPDSPVSLDFAIGIKQVGGEYTDDLALVVCVPEKLPPEQVPPEQLIPPEFEGFLTDVVALQPELISDETAYNPLRGGIQISRPGVVDASGLLHVSVGTAGAVVRDATGAKALLTCEHVIPNQGSDVFQAGQGATGSRVIGTAGLSATGTWLDCAIVKPDSSQRFLLSVEDIGPVRGTNVISLWDAVKKRGSRTLKTEGVVVAIFPDQGTTAIQGMLIDTFPFGGLFCWHGDSGSAVLNARDEVVGLLYAMNDFVSDQTGTPVKAVGVASTLLPVQQALSVDVAFAPGVTRVDPDNALSLIGTLGTVTIDGWGFDTSSTVAFGGVTAISSNFVSSNQMTAIPPVTPLAGEVDVQITSGFGEKSELNQAAKFQF